MKSRLHKHDPVSKQTKKVPKTKQIQLKLRKITVVKGQKEEDMTILNDDFFLF
jgi:hypothetical protein